VWRRVLLVLLAYSTIVVVGLAVPLALTVSQERLQRFGESRFAAAAYFAGLAARDADQGGANLQEALTRYHWLYGEPVLVVDRTGRPLASAGMAPGSDDVDLAVAQALRNQRSALPASLSPWSHPDALIAVPVGAGTQVDGAVVLRASTAAAAADVGRAWAVIAAGAGGLLLLATVIAVVLSRWTVRPVTALSERVHALGDQVLEPVPAAHPGPPAQSAGYAGPPEVRQLARVFDTMAADVEAAAAAQRRMVADSAHALRNPLAALRIRLDTLGLALSGKSAETHHRAMQEVDRLSGVVADLLTLASAESAPTADQAPPRCDVVTVLAERHDSWSDAVAAAAMTMTVATPHTAPAAIDADDLGTIVDVLLSNATAYAGAGTEIELGCSADGSRVHIWVADTGRGVATTELEHLADRFYRASGTSGPGTGLGLAIARALTERAGGRLTITAGRPRGLRVEAALPRSS
jgi:signal transduction histidine kinase